MLSKCLFAAIKKEAEIPKIINKILLALMGETTFDEKENMRSAEDIMKDYGL